VEQNEMELEKDVEVILSELSGQKVIFVSHVLPYPISSINLEKRELLIRWLTKICKNKNIDIILPSECKVPGLLGKDLGHYNEDLRDKFLLPYFREKLTEFGL